MSKCCLLEVFYRGIASNPSQLLDHHPPSTEVPAIVTNDAGAVHRFRPALGTENTVDLLLTFPAGCYPARRTFSLSAMIHLGALR